MLRVGFVGAGGQATQNIYPSLRHAPIELVSIADHHRDLAERNARWFGAREVYGTHQELLDHSEIDAVFVVGPPAMQHSVGLDVLAAGKHLFVEKPPANNLADAVELRDRARQAGVQLMVGFMKRFATAYVRAAEIAAGPEFGQPRLVRIDWAHWTVDEWRRDAWGGIHALDLARFFLGDVTGGSVNRRDFSDGRVLTVELDHAGGGTSQLNLSSCAPAVKEAVDLYGASQVIQVRNLTELRHYHKAATIEESAAIGRDESMVSMWHPEFTIPWRDNEGLVLQGFAGEVKHFAERILAGKAVESSIDDGVEVIRIMEGMELAPAGRSPLRLPDL